MPTIHDDNANSARQVRARQSAASGNPHAVATSTVARGAGIPDAELDGLIAATVPNDGPDCQAQADDRLAVFSDLEIMDELMLRVRGLTATPADVSRALDEVRRRAVKAFGDTTGAQRTAAVELMEALHDAGRTLDRLDAS